MEKEYESIKAKLKKTVGTRRTRGAGRSRECRILLEKLCKEYGIRIDELLDENQVKYYFFDVGRNKTQVDLFSQCYYKVANASRMSYKQVSRSRIAVEMTAIQYAELVSLFEWHKANFNKDLEDMKHNILIAYCRKHHLYGDIDSDDSRELTAEEKKRLVKILFMQESLNDNQYHKLLEQ